MNSNQWEQVKEIFHGAAAMSEAEREDFLLSRCGDDSEILQELRSLFQAHAEYDGFIESPAYRSVSSLVEGGEIESRIGSIIGAYRLEKEIGRGGMGTVYLASRADRAFDKKVAVKLIKRGFDTDEIVRRFRDERQILAALEHPNITRLLDGGSTADGLPFLVMDYVDGLPLIEYCEHAKLSIPDRLELFLLICSAVSYAHRNLVIHRDLKPSNILVTSDGTPKLLDFGIAKLTAASGSDEPTRGTLNDMRAMTPEYASPEQINGQAVTTTSDVYSLGIILYELLSGHKPYHFANHSTDEINRILSSTTAQKPSSVCKFEGPSGMTVESHVVSRQLRGDLDKIIFMAMRTESDRRYSSVEQFANDIRRHLKGLPVIAQDDSLGYRASKFIQRNKPGVAAGLGITASLVGGFIVAMRQARIAARQRDRSERTYDFLQEVLSSADPRKAGKDLRVVEMLELAAETIETQFGSQPGVASDLNATIGLTYLSLGRIEPAGKHLRSALELRLRNFSQDSIPVARALHDYGKYLHAKGDLSGAEPYYREALATFRRRSPNSLYVAETLASLGYLTALMGDSEQAIRLHSKELEIKRRHLGDSHADVARAMSRLASVMSIIGRHETAEPLHTRALQILRAINGAQHPDIALVLNDMVRTVLPRDPASAERLCREALAMRRKLLDEDHPDVAWTLYNLAYVLIARERYAEAGEILRETLARRGTSLPDEHPIVASCLVLQGRIFMAERSYDLAHERFVECLRLRSKTLDPGHWLIAVTKSHLGECLILQGNQALGRELVLNSYEDISERLGPNHEITRQAKLRIV